MVPRVSQQQGGAFNGKPHWQRWVHIIPLAVSSVPSPTVAKHAVEGKEIPTRCFRVRIFRQNCLTVVFVSVGGMIKYASKYNLFQFQTIFVFLCYRKHCCLTVTETRVRFPAWVIVCVEFAHFRLVCVHFLRVLQFPPTLQSWGG